MTRYFDNDSIFNRKSCKQTVEPDQTLQSVASDLGLYNLSMSHKKRDRLTWVKKIVVYVTHINFIVPSSNWIIFGYKTV